VDEDIEGRSKPIVLGRPPAHFSPPPAKPRLLVSVPRCRPVSRVGCGPAGVRPRPALRFARLRSVGAGRSGGCVAVCCRSRCPALPSRVNRIWERGGAATRRQETATRRPTDRGRPTGAGRGAGRGRTPAGAPHPRNGEAARHRSEGRGFEGAWKRALAGRRRSTSPRRRVGPCYQESSPLRPHSAP